MQLALLTGHGSEHGLGEKRGKWGSGGEGKILECSTRELCRCIILKKNLVQTIAKKLGNHSSSQQCWVISDIDVKQTPLGMDVCTNFVYNIPQCVYNTYIHDHMLITSGSANSLKETNHDSF